MTVLDEPVNATAAPERVPHVDFDTSPDRYRHWRFTVDGDTATVYLDVDEAGGLVPGYELKLNSYDLGVDIELHDLTQRLRFEHPQVRSIVLTSGKDSNFCAGANIRMLAGSSHPWKVNFCKFTNETRNGIEDMSAAGQTWIAALNGTAAGGGYEMALACERILLVDDRSSAVSLPEVPLLGVLPGTGGLTRVIDKRRVRKDRADVFATKSEGFGGRKAVEWKLVDEAVARREWDRVVAERAQELRGDRPADAQGVALTPLQRTVTDDAITYDHVRATIDRDARTATLVVAVPDTLTDDPQQLHDQGAQHPLLAIVRELDDAILRLRTNELEIGTWLILTEGTVDAALAADRLIAEHQDDWLVAETTRFLKRTLKRLDVTSRSLIALIEPGSCFAGPFLELALACDRQYMLEGTFEEAEDATLPSGAAATEPATLVVTQAQFGTFPMGNGLSRLESRFYGESLDGIPRDEPLTGADADDAGLVTDAPDDIDWTDEIRILLEERASLSPDALTGMEANHRFVGPETMETRIFGRLTAWQNWIFIRPNASGPEGALRKYGTGRKADFDQKRV
ncbi:2,3-epoxybenzoyl-CoA dihydrolase [Actinomycetospora sp. NBRC 106378]|uniref:2,3-epoxybenzoyl-CoA dihydrolase n=1 Tax=Actinomycetospora sp. NBRC 106378 TaxID=3032208 RepID=UPI0025562A7F|nr:2,3-epoxybenzoyl-CoA dihydrolase [Actinomycetospora sp. NBRC 106378]